MANKTTGNFVGVSDQYLGTSGAWSITEARERSLSTVHNSDWGSFLLFAVDFLVIAGGGGGGTSSATLSRSAGGGAGGYINSYAEESSGGSTSSLPSITCSTAQTFPDLTVTVGAGGSVGTSGSNSVFSGKDFSDTAFSNTAVGGGYGAGNSTANGATGGSGGGEGILFVSGSGFSNGNTTGPSGTANQGTAGGGRVGTGSPRNAGLCAEFGSEFWCYNDNPNYGAGGGGGAGSSTSSSDGGDGLSSGITGTGVTRAGGGYGEGSSKAAGTAGSGQSAAGGGGNATSAGNDGVVILRYPSTVAISFNALDLTGSTATVGSDKVTTFTAGSGTVSFSEV